MRRTASVPVAASILLLAAGIAPAVASPHTQLDFELKSGNYSCEHGLSVSVTRSVQSADKVQIDWKGKSYNLARDTSFSGLPRYEDRSNGLVWIDLPWKSVLLDGRTQKPLANDCTTA